MIRILLVMVSILFLSTNAFSSGEEIHDSDKGSHVSHDSHKSSKNFINVGNKFCPVSKELIAEVGDGKGIQVEHEGKIYNLCCTMCAKDFNKNPEKFVKMIEEMMEEGDDEDEGESGYQEHKGSHHHDYGDHDH